MLSSSLFAAIVVSLGTGQVVSQSCPSYSSYSQSRHEPYSTGAYALAYQRPAPGCRTFNSTGVEDAILRIKNQTHDPDLSRLFENTFPNTLDTAIKWRGVAANNSEEELAFIITGDIDAMWIRDSANQVAPYRSILKSKTDDIASVFRGTINLQARYLILSPYCNSFLPPPESGLKPGPNGATYSVKPSYDHNVVFTCNFELDDFGGFLQLSHDYYTQTGDVDFFGRFQWLQAVQSIVAAADAMRAPTYGPDGAWIPPVYSFQSQTMTSMGTLGNNGMNYPVNFTGMVRSPFRPSDDAAIYDFQIPANMLLARYLDATSAIVERLPNAPKGLAAQMRDMAGEIRAGIEHWGVVTTPGGQKIYAYEVDGFGGQNLMDDANIPSLLSAPRLGYLDANDTVYQNTRGWVLSRNNPWWCAGPVINAVGSPHIKPGAAWPMAAIMRAMTSDDDLEIINAIKEVVQSTDGFGLIHESVNSFDAGQWTRSWFGWGNAVFGQMIMEFAERKPHILQESFQPFFIAKY
ncbi:Uu.00g143070.m01.CDS01 [Anthostomella pinea]|uniref:Uu.00g143070.m01.CDS01 n=1 Tax=Anthostomella pinea TaxID=933095 RepID=A0AAI8VQJ7_9PEZI|nr:Uu.00g143070.m01.CDS01 [Anthostomella pinea]